METIYQRWYCYFYGGRQFCLRSTEQGKYFLRQLYIHSKITHQSAISKEGLNEQWVRRVRRFGVSFASLVAVSAFGPLRLHGPALARLTPTLLESKPNYPLHAAPLNPAALDDDDKAAGAQSSRLSRGKRDDQRVYSARRYLQLGYLEPLPPFLCDHIVPHKRPDTADILNLAAKGRLRQDNDDTSYWCANPA